MTQEEAKVAAQRIAKAITALEYAQWVTHRTKFDDRMRAARGILFDVMTELGYEFAACDSSRVRKIKSK